MTLGVGAERVAAVLEDVGLAGKPARKRVRTYSLGMRQRLGIAHALLGEPEVLILDEPANGLDPEGIIWMRRLLRDFADRAGTVLLSSHLLREVEKIADQLVVIGEGRVVAQGRRRRPAGRRRRPRGPLHVPARRRSVAMTLWPFRAFAPAPSLPRLVAIELRKTVDTRAGFWLLAASALLAIVVVGLTLAFGHATDLMFGVFFARTVGTVGVLLPVVGILAITSEWSQRTAVTTFALVPRRERVIAAKLLAGLVVALASVAVCLAISLAATALVPGDRARRRQVRCRGLRPRKRGAVHGDVDGRGRRARIAGDALRAGDRPELPHPDEHRGHRGRHSRAPSARCGGSTSGWPPASSTPAIRRSRAPNGRTSRAAVAIWVLVPLAIGFVRLRRGEVTSS